jgi:hypothetical protein
VRQWRLWLPVALAIGGISVGLGLADAGRQPAALILLGASILLMGVSVGYWLHYDHKEDD